MAITRALPVHQPMVDRGADTDTDVNALAGPSDVRGGPDEATSGLDSGLSPGVQRVLDSGVQTDAARLSTRSGVKRPQRTKRGSDDDENRLRAANRQRQRNRRQRLTEAQLEAERAIQRVRRATARASVRPSVTVAVRFVRRR
jgi:hypothetical protein